MASKKKTTKKKTAKKAPAKKRKTESLYGANEQPRGCVRCGSTKRKITHTFFGPEYIKRRRCQCTKCGQRYITSEDTRMGCQKED
jgi:predicted  nucleic acid-binding Zn-ribbon protein